jgi:hypothetical protein
VFNVSHYADILIAGSHVKKRITFIKTEATPPPKQQHPILLCRTRRFKDILQTKPLESFWHAMSSAEAYVGRGIGGFEEIAFLGFCSGQWEERIYFC